MRRTLMLMVASALLALLLPSAPATAAKLPSEKQWHADVTRAMHGSRAYLNGVVPTGGEKLAIVLDIDNTSLATYYQPGAPVKAVRAFARTAIRNGDAVLFDTGRLRRQLKEAHRLLQKAGFPITAMCGRKKHETLAESKPRCRQAFIDDGYTIVANVGNRDTDFSGDQNYGRGFRLPDYGGRLG